MAGRKGTGEADFWLGFTKASRKRKEGVRLTFRNDSFRKVSRIERIKFEIINDNLYAREPGYEGEGQPISLAGTTYQMRCTWPAAVKWFKKHGTGEYDFEIYDGCRRIFRVTKAENKENLSSGLAFEEGDKIERFDMVISLTPNQGQVLEILATCTGRAAEEIAHDFIVDKINNITDKINDIKGCLKGE